MSKKFQALRGFADFYPEDKALQNWLFEKMRKITKSFGFQEYEGPILESLSLFEAKSGQELVSEQTFKFKDRSQRMVALRPELTPTMARMIAAKASQIPFPTRWFSIGPFFRYEKPQAGRTRQFYQWNVDLIGPSTPEADAEVIAIAAQFFQELGLDASQVVIKISDRKLIETRLEIIGIPKSKFGQVFKIIDKKSKIGKVEFESLLKRSGLGKDQVGDVGKILSDYDYSEESDNLTAIFANLKDLGFASYVTFDPSIVRGLDYYTGTVFEAYDRAGRFRAILAGGRYDNLISEFGGPKLVAIGFAAGDKVILEVLEYLGKLPTVPSEPSKMLVSIFDQSTIRESLKLASFLRGEGVTTELYPEAAKLDKQIRFALKKDIPYIAIVGPEEAVRKTVTVKILATGEQFQVSQEELPSLIKNGFRL